MARTRSSRVRSRFSSSRSPSARCWSLLFAGPLSEALLDRRDTELLLITAGGLWVFTLYELMMALFRLDERARAYFTASFTNVLLTIALTVWLVVFEDEGARGLLLGNFGGSALVLAALLWIHRARLGLVPSRARLGEMLRFGLPTMPAELSLYALNFVDRVALARLAGLAEAGLYALAVKFSQVVTVIVRGFNLAWPPLAYSIRDDDTARRTYSVVITYYLLLAFTVVLALSLEARWVVRALAAPDFFDAYKAVPLVSTGVALYALYLVLSVSVSRTGRTAFNFPVTGAALAVNIALNLVLVPPYGLVGAGIALVGAYVVMIALMYGVTRRIFPLDLEWGRLVRIVGIAAALFAAGELLLPTSGIAGFLARGAVALSYLPLLWASGFFGGRGAGCDAPRDRARARCVSAAVAGSGSPAHPHGADGRGARPPVGRSAPRARWSARPPGSRRRSARRSGRWRRTRRSGSRSRGTPAPARGSVQRRHIHPPPEAPARRPV